MESERGRASRSSFAANALRGFGDPRSQLGVRFVQRNLEQHDASGSVSDGQRPQQQVGGCRLRRLVMRRMRFEMRVTDMEE